MRNILLISTLLLCISVASFFKIAPYLGHNYYYLIGFDSGKYVNDLKNKVSTNVDNLDLWVEPGLNSNLVSLKSISSLDEISIYKYHLPIFVSIFFILMIFLFTREISGSIVAGLLSSLYFSISIIFLNSTFDSYYRQIFGTIIYMVFLFYSYRLFIRKKVHFKHILLLGILGAGIIVSHRAVTLLYIITLFFLFVLQIVKRRFYVIRDITIILFISALLSSSYWLFIIYDNVIVFKESIIATLGRKSGGNTTIKQLKRNDNQIYGYLTSIPLSFLPFISVVFIAVKKRITLLTPFIFFLLLYIYFKASFSNRFLFNLEILLSIVIGIYLYTLLNFVNKKLVFTIIIFTFIVGSIFVLDNSVNRRPYLDQPTQGIRWIENNIDTRSSILIAPDAMSTILTEMGYDTALYKYPVKLGSGVDIAKASEEILVDGCKKNLLLKGKFDIDKDVYIIFDQWNLSYPLPRFGKVIPIDEWDKCNSFEKIYDNDSYVYRVYKLKKNYQ